jgi:hypothetical protein
MLSDLYCQKFNPQYWTSWIIDIRIYLYCRKFNPSVLDLMDDRYTYILYICISVRNLLLMSIELYCLVQVFLRT